MKKIFIATIICFSVATLNAQVGIGTTNPNASSALDITSSNSGVLLPRLTTAQRNGISNPATGLLVFNTDTNLFEYNIGTNVAPNWISLGKSETQAGTYHVGTTSFGWNYYNVTFAETFSAVPSINLTFREGTGTDGEGTRSVNHFKVANASNTGFTIAIYDSWLSSSDIYIDWIATPRTQ